MRDKCARSSRWHRFEAKYIIGEQQAAEVRRYCLDHIPPDPHALDHTANTYPILSVYFDSPAHQLLDQTLQRRSYRYKLRVRSYCDHRAWLPEMPAFVEIKRKVYGVVHKSRTSVAPPVTASLLSEGRAGADELGSRESFHDITLSEFLRLGRQISAAPIVGVFYEREAYEGQSLERIRITCDRNLHCGLLTMTRKGLQGIWWPVRTSDAILEVKFTNTYPFWVSNMLHRLEALQRGVCKYAICSHAAETFGVWPQRVDRSKV